MGRNEMDQCREPGARCRLYIIIKSDSYRVAASRVTHTVYIPQKSDSYRVYPSKSDSYRVYPSKSDSYRVYPSKE
ncbi:hypothetical protein Hamer_G016900 [Homarus americanus]|uniref:Uncharacterized protein n=1 Tax=Homarus americanus TaxID=6706 RepID=A0A8J5NAS8_HOMAM|nr:hypothetical protein Hamer_G016900 [Homarus americanus]